MAQHLIIVTGCPGSGKSTFAAQVCARLPHVALLAYDAVKEEYFDRYGFADEIEKERVNALSLRAYYRRLGALMRQGRDILIEYPFWDAHRDDLRQLVEKHGYQVMTVLLEGDPQVLHQRGLLRDQLVGRHPGHLHTAYVPGNEAANPINPQAMSLEAFQKLCATRNYDICLGTCLRVDVTDPAQTGIQEAEKAIGAFLSLECAAPPG